MHTRAALAGWIAPEVLQRAAAPELAPLGQFRPAAASEAETPAPASEADENYRLIPLG